MKIKYSSWLLTLVFTIPGMVKAADYPVSSIPKPLLQHANAVIRKQEQRIEVDNLNKVKIKDHYIITILNEAGEQYAFWQEGYSKLESIEHIEGYLFDANGNKIRTLKKSEIKDEPVSSEITMIQDNRVKYHSFYYKQFPYTVEYSSEVIQNQTMFLPGWAPLPGRNISVEESSLTVVTSADYEIRNRIYNIPQPPAITTNGKIKTMVWEIRNQPAVAREYAAPPIHELAPYISFAATDFKLEDYQGSMRTWEDYGKFINTLNDGLAELSPAIQEKVKQIVAGASSDQEKVYRLYHFLQENTHYISIQLGIGGWKPFPANYVASKGYGDCKALSNFMVALLKVAGIKANYVLIWGGERSRDIPTDFPAASYFNHAICAVPMKNDTIWLECTSQTKAAGYMGAFTGNRHALMITEQGGKLVTTPTYAQEQNLVSGNIRGQIDLSGNLDLKAVVKYQAETTDDLHMRIHSYSREEQLKYLKKYLDIPHYDVADFGYEETDGKLPTITEQLHVTAPGYAQITGKRLFIQPNILNRWNDRLPVDTARLYPIDLSDARIESDSVLIDLPEGYQVESLPKPTDVSTPFGRYSAAAKLEGTKLIYQRKLYLNKGRFTAKQYNDLLNFYEQIYKADRTKVVLVKKDQ